jgi:hypothetical protein
LPPPRAGRNPPSATTSSTPTSTRKGAIRDINPPPKSRARCYRRSSQNAPSCSPLEVHCDWLRETSYVNVDCYLKVLELAIFGGQRPG